jgi:hypothetical protein
VYSSKVHKFFELDELMDGVMKNDELFVYELPQGEEAAVVVAEEGEVRGGDMEDAESGEDAGVLVSPVKEDEVEERKKIHVAVCQHEPATYGTRKFGTPFVLEMYDDEVEKYPVKKLQEEIRSAMAVFVPGADPSHEGLYDIHFGDSYTLSAAVNVEEEFVNLKEHSRPSYYSKTKEFSLGLKWAAEHKLKYVDAVVRDASMGEEVIGEDGATGVETLEFEDCMREFTREEKLEEGEEWYCRDCKKHKRADKTINLWKMPDTLVSHLKRFSYTRWNRDKLGSFVNFPLEGLDMSQWIPGEGVNKNNIYDLYAVSNHFGGMGGGHYTAFAKNFNSGKWYDLNDSSASEVSASDVRTAAAYVLFYRKRDTTP